MEVRQTRLRRLQAHKIAPLCDDEISSQPLANLNIALLGNWIRSHFSRQKLTRISLSEVCKSWILPFLAKTFFAAGFCAHQQFFFVSLRVAHCSVLFVHTCSVFFFVRFTAIRERPPSTLALFVWLPTSLTFPFLGRYFSYASQLQRYNSGSTNSCGIDT